jgi:putative PIN family toxin of toxin-antitoxin system
MRVVFDTNVLVSALVTAGGRGEAALLRAVEGTDRLLTSKAIVDELLGVLARKFGRDREQLARVAIFLSDVAELVQTTRPIHLLADEPDNRVLECAVSGNADTIVTGDRALLDLEAFEGIRILSLRDYLLGESAPGNQQ